MLSFSLSEIKASDGRVLHLEVNTCVWLQSLQADEKQQSLDSDFLTAPHKQTLHRKTVHDIPLASEAPGAFHQACVCFVQCNIIRRQVPTMLYHLKSVSQSSKHANV